MKTDNLIYRGYELRKTKTGGYPYIQWYTIFHNGIRIGATDTFNHYKTALISAKEFVDQLLTKIKSENENIS